MYLCEWLYQARTVSDHVFVWVVVPRQNSERSCMCASGCAKPKQLAIIHLCEWLCQARTVSDHVFEWVVVPSQNSEQSCIFVSGCTKQEQWAIMYLWVFVPSQNSERSCIWVSVCAKPEQWAIMYLCDGGIDFVSFYDISILFWNFLHTLEFVWFFILLQIQYKLEIACTMFYRDRSTYCFVLRPFST
jgi:hypothetical protein